MIIAQALKNLFQDKAVIYNKQPLIVNGVPIILNFHWGDQKELNQWVMDKTKQGVTKYPLVWYVLSPYNELNGVYYSECTMVIMQKTVANYLNDKRMDEIYSPVIEPSWQYVKKLILENAYINVVSSELKNKFTIKDEPNYGMDTNNENLQLSDFKGQKEFGIKNGNIDVVDTRFIKFRLEIKANCITN